MNHLKIVRVQMSELGIELQKAVTAELRARRAVNALAKQYSIAVRRYRMALQRAVPVQSHRRTSSHPRLSHRLCNQQIAGMIRSGRPKG
jgi:hypothetical protein